jgi:choline dehydrogenase-like flavoprotein
MFRGEALGGSSRVNGMLLTRGLPGEYNKWRDMGNAGWGYDSLKPCFARAENTLSQPKSDHRGKEGMFFSSCTSVSHILQGGFVNQTFTEYPFRVLKW